jgi:hypothetical protein
MMNHTFHKQHSNELWSNSPVDGTSLNSFAGTFSFSDHYLVPELIRDLVMSQRNEDKFVRIPLSAINDIANAFWEGPGSCARISDIVWDCRIARAFGATFTESKNAHALNYTVADWQAIADA